MTDALTAGTALTTPEVTKKKKKKTSFLIDVKSGGNV